jgi:putative methionine-R-sulfoxide reductase with GAF domain
MTSMREDEKPWKTNLAQKSKERRENVLQEVEDSIKKAASFEDALKVAVEIMKRRFSRYSGITAYVADGEDLAVHTTLERPAGPERVWSGGGPLAEVAHGHATQVVADVSTQPAWAGVGLAKGSVMVSPIRTDAGLWAILEVWSDFRDAFTSHDIKLIDKVVAALARKTPAA